MQPCSLTVTKTDTPLWDQAGPFTAGRRDIPAITYPSQLKLVLGSATLEGRKAELT